MNPMLEQFLEPFLLESRDFLQSIGEKLMALEENPTSQDMINELFRYVHTLKGNSGIFEFPEMTRVLHAGEDLMDKVRQGQLGYSRALADLLLEAMDYVSMLLDELERTHDISPTHGDESARLTQALREFIAAAAAQDVSVTEAAVTPVTHEPVTAPSPPVTRRVAPANLADALLEVPERARQDAFRAAASGHAITWVRYVPEPESLFKGEDPFRIARHVPALIWGGLKHREAPQSLTDLDYYCCNLRFDILSVSDRASLNSHFRHQIEQVTLTEVSPWQLVIPTGEPNGGPVYGDFVAEATSLLGQGDLSALADAARTLLDLSSPALWLASALRWLLLVIDVMPDHREAMGRLVRSLEHLTPPDLGDLDMPVATPSAPTPHEPVQPVAGTPLSAEDRACLEHLFDVQERILALPDRVLWLHGRLSACANTLRAGLHAWHVDTQALDEALAAALLAESAEPLARWWQQTRPQLDSLARSPASQRRTSVTEPPVTAAVAAPTVSDPSPLPAPEQTLAPVERLPAASSEPPRTTRRDTPENTASNASVRKPEESHAVNKVLKVDQAKVDHLMNLIGEMVVAKNALPYLANRAENQFGVRELSREIKEQYAVINRIAEDMQDAIMQVRMMPVSFVFQRFPRLVRDIARKLGKEVELVLDGESTEADKHVIESLADPLIHIVRNSLDHGLETPDVRRAAGKPETGTLTIRAMQESDRVIIEINDDGKGIDPEIIKRKAYEKGLIDENQLERLSDHEAVQLVFAAGFSTAETITDLSGRGVGMDVVRSAIDRVGGSITLHSEKGRGTSLRLSLPLSMAVTNVMIVESDHQIFGLPMDKVVETVRLPRADIRTIKKQKTVVLRGQIVPLLALNDLLAIPVEPVANHEDELAALVVRIGNEQVGLLVDDFKGVVDVILKPLPGELSRLSCYAGTALLGDGSVLMVLNPKELI